MKQWRRHGGGGNCPPYDFEGGKGEEGKRRKGRGKKKKGGEKKKKEKREERKKENKQTNKKPGYGILRFIHKFSKILPIGWVPARSLRSLALTHC